MNGIRTAICALAIAIQVRLPVLIWGPPGTGKSATMLALGEALGLPVEVVIASIREPSDFAGLPVVDNGGVSLAPPSWAKRLKEADKGILFLDEVSCFAAGTPVQCHRDGYILEIPIEDVRENEGVVSVDLQGGHARHGRVTRAIKREARECVEVIFTDGTYLVCTPDHKLMMESGWVPAAECRGGLSTAGTTVPVGVEEVRRHPGKRDVFDLTVEPDHNYIAGGVLVHNCAPPATQAALLRVVLDGVVGDLTLPESVSVCAAANPPEMAAGGWDLSPPMANRFIHLDWPTEANAWCEGMVAGWPEPPCPKVPDGWRDQTITARAMAAGFIKARPTLLQQLPKEESQAGKAWPSQRSWEMATMVRAACIATAAGDEVEGKLVGGCIGDAAALEYLNWQRELDLPDPEELLRDAGAGKLRWKAPARGDRLYAILGSVVGAVVHQTTVKRWEAAWRILERGASQQPDIAAAASRPLAGLRKKNPKLKAPREAGRLLPLLRDAGMV